MSGLLAALPVQLIACQLITPGNHSSENFPVRQESPNADTRFSQQTIVLPNGYTAFPDVGVAMKYYANDLTWNLARKHCATDGGNLAVIDSFEKGQYANKLRNSNPRGPFLGIHKLYDGIEWISVKTGMPLDFIPWKSGLDRGASAPSCTALYGDFGGRVGPFDCNKSWSYVCEVPIHQDQSSKIEVQSSLIQTDEPVLNDTLQHTDSGNIPAN